MEQILQYKNPKDIIQLANNNNCLNDNNSYLWNNLLIKYYYNFIKYKNKNISIKDFYVLLYYSEILGLINFIPILDRAQHTLSLLPKIYPMSFSYYFIIAFIMISISIYLLRNSRTSRQYNRINNVYKTLIGLAILSIAMY